MQDFKPIMLDGKRYSAQITSGLRMEVKRLKDYFKCTPTIGIITVGDDEASKVYVGRKMKQLEELECVGIQFKLTGNATTQLNELIKILNESKLVHGYIIQEPLPEQFKGVELEKINPIKDIDGFVPDSNYTSCTPLGIVKLMKHYGISLTGKYVVIANRSHLVGRPLADLLMSQGATVTMIHTGTPEETKRNLIKNCDIFVSAIGKPNYWTEDWFVSDEEVPREAIIDVGINRVDGKLCGDVHPDSYKHFLHYTPVPGGVGAMTVAMFLDNSIESATNNREGGI